MSKFETVPTGKSYWERLRNEEETFIQNSLKNLKNMINNDKGIVKQPRLENGAVVFNYQNVENYIYKGLDFEIVTRKNGNSNYSVRIKKWVKFPDGKEGWETQKNGNNDTFTFKATNKKSFNYQLGYALDTIIGKNRDRLPRTGGIVYDLLNGGGIKITPQQKSTENKATAEEQVENIEMRDMPKGLELDNGTYVYTVQPGDCEGDIKKKLSRYAPLSYLKNVPNGIEGWNFDTIPDNKLLPGLKILVPKQNLEKEKTISDFRESQKLALKDMKNNPTYGNYIKKLINEFGELHIANVMTAYAKSECCPEDYDDKVGKYSLFRYESNPKYLCPSYGYHHILYKGAGLAAFKNIGITIGQSCNPKESGKLFLAFCIEKINGAQQRENRGYENFKKYFNMGDTNRCAVWYNGGEPGYADKLKNNFDKVKNTR